MAWLLRRTLAVLASIPLTLAAPVLALIDARARVRLRHAMNEVAVQRRARRAETASPPPDVAGMQAALTRALDAAGGNRARFRYLARFEAAFATHGLVVLHNAPVKGLKRALAEFEAMVRNWSDPLLAELRSRLAVTVAERGSASAVWRASAMASIASVASMAPIARVARGALARASTFRTSRAVDLDAVTR